MTATDNFNLYSNYLFNEGGNRYSYNGATFDLSRMSDVNRARMAEALEQLAAEDFLGVPGAQTVMSGLQGKVTTYTDNLSTYNSLSSPVYQVNQPVQGATNNGYSSQGSLIFVNPSATGLAAPGQTSFSDFVGAGIHETLHAAGFDHGDPISTNPTIQYDPVLDAPWVRTMDSIKSNLPSTIYDPAAGPDGSDVAITPQTYAYNDQLVYGASYNDADPSSSQLFVTTGSAQAGPTRHLQQVNSSRICPTAPTPSL